MFSYYGSKSNIVDFYPKPVFDKIIEPFAGSARYSLKYWDRDILLVDKYEVVVRIWKWLQSCSPVDILSLPKLKTGLLISELSISEDEKLFLGMCAGVSSVSPRNKVSMFAGEQNGRKNKMKYIADSLHKIRHWDIRLGSYEELKNEKATWFIDPPYQFGGHAYVEKNIDYLNLSNWCVKRKGQCIVCENTKANWLPFNAMVASRGVNQKFTTEAVWTNYPTHYNNEQMTFFK